MTTNRNNYLRSKRWRRRIRTKRT